jgi:hypothetical protein
MNSRKNAQKKGEDPCTRQLPASRMDRRPEGTVGLLSWRDCMTVAWQFITWVVCTTESVPKGPSERSQAIYCLGSPALKTRPVRVRYDPVSQRWFGVYGGKKPIAKPIIPYPAGRIRYRTDSQALKCLATFTLSLRDKVPQPSSGQIPTKSARDNSLTPFFCVLCAFLRLFRSAPRQLTNLIFLP